MNYGGHYVVTPKELAMQARAEDVHVIENLIVNKEQRFPDIAWFTGKPDVASTATNLIVSGQEYHTSYWGHTGLLAITDHIQLPGYAGYQGTAAASLVPMNADVMRLARAQRGVTGYVHPFDDPVDPADTAAALHSELPVDVALGLVDYMEILGFSDHRNTAAVWYKLLNCGFRIPAGAGTDAMTNYASLRGPVGLNRVYVKAGVPLTHPKFLAALKAGRTFATNGPLLELTVNGREIGSEIALPNGMSKLTIRGRMRSIVAVDKVEIVVNGNVVDSLPLSADHKSRSGHAHAHGEQQLVGDAARVERALAGADPGHLSVRDHEPRVHHRGRTAAALGARHAILHGVARRGCSPTPTRTRITIRRRRKPRCSRRSGTRAPST